MSTFCLTFGRHKSSVDLHTCSKDIALFKPTMISKTWVILKIAHGVIGMSAGISGCIVFARNYDNVNGAVWAAISALVAFLYVIVNRSVYRDVARVMSTQCFSIYMVLGCVFIVAGSVAMITYLAFGLSHKQGANTT